MAEGGKREEGTLKEKKARKPLVRPASELGLVILEDESRKENRVRKIGRNTRQKKKRINRGSRMLPERREGSKSKGGVRVSALALMGGG